MPPEGNSGANRRTPTGTPLAWRAVTPHASTPLPGGACDGLYVSAGGVVSFKDLTGATVTVNGTAGGYIDCQITHVISPTTTATVVAMYRRTPDA